MKTVKVKHKRIDGSDRKALGACNEWVENSDAVDSWLKTTCKRCLAIKTKRDAYRAAVR